MRIAINCQLLSMHRTGVGRYIRELVKALAQVDHENEYILYANLHIPEGVLPTAENFTIKLTRFPVYTPFLRILWEQLLLPVALLRDRVDVIHFPDQSYPLLPLPCANVITVHDLIFNIYPQAYTRLKRLYKNLVMRVAIARASQIIVDAESTKQDVIKAYGVSGDNITAIHCGLSEHFGPISDKAELANTRKRLGLPKQFILHVGTLAPDKNLVSLVEAYALLKGREDIPHRLVTVGPKGWLYDSLYHKVKRLDLQDDVLFLGYVDDEDLVRIYNLADVFVFPSLYEGFGFPVLEAMACGTPVVTSDVSSLPEIVGDAALLVDPQDHEAIAVAILKVLKEEPLRKRLISQDFNQVRAFSWQRTALQTLQVYIASASGSKYATAREDQATPRT